jgi:serine/threonine-protein kinase
MTTPIPFGRFLLVERVAIGGMAEVYAAVDRTDPGRRLCAIKRLLPTLAEDRELVRLFLDEARLTVQLEHPGVVAVHELGRIGAGYYMAMEYVPGRDLRALVALHRRRGERIPVDVAAHVVARAAEALDHAHRRLGPDGTALRVVHRDVSPGNVLVGFDGIVRVIDFGIASAALRGARAAPGRGGGGPVLRGKFGYMSPELVRGLPVDRRSDVFALGIVLHELLAGERLFAGPSELAVMERVRAAEVRPPSASRPDLPRALDAVVLRALAREPEDRFAWASELAAALAPFDPLGGGPGPAAGVLARRMAEWFPEALRDEEARRDLALTA